MVLVVATAAFTESPHDLASRNGPSWRPWEYVAVNTYPIMAIAFLVVVACLAYRRREADRVDSVVCGLSGARVDRDGARRRWRGR